ncbi:MAG: diaminopimelate epimerase [Deltaproteobacteria bacterium]|nr:MAG: diaminopimelate epimerase [Deltaproteobacteria bacterium]
MHTSRCVLQTAAARPGRAARTARTLQRMDVRYEYRRYQALGNDYIVVGEDMTELLSEPARIRRLCDRHIGLGSDGILLPTAPPDGFAAAVRILNPDGSEAEKSGNGVRIFAKHCFDHLGTSPAQPLRIHTLGGAVSARLIVRERDRSVLSVTMGRASFRCEDLPMSAPGEWLQKDLECGGRVFPITAVSMGNPHAVIIGNAPGAALDEETVRSFGPHIENHPIFPQRTNVQFVRVVDREAVEAMIWERGAGWTLSSGSSACAVVAACVRAGLTDRNVEVRMPGGELRVTIGGDWQVEQVGWVQELMTGVIARELLASLAV